MQYETWCLQRLRIEMGYSGVNRLTFQNTRFLKRHGPVQLRAKPMTYHYSFQSCDPIMPKNSYRQRNFNTKFFL